MPSRIANPSLVVPGVLEALLQVNKGLNEVMPLRTLVLMHLRISQINGRAIHIPVKRREFEEAGEEDKRLPLVATWRDETCFNDAERAALALAEAATLISGRQNPVPDEVWEEAARHYNETELSAMVIHIGMVNLWNRVNVCTQQEAADWRINPDKWVPFTKRPA